MDQDGLENRSRGNSTGGSNPPLSATIQTLTLPVVSDTRPVEKNEQRYNAEVSFSAIMFVTFSMTITNSQEAWNHRLPVPPSTSSSVPTV